MQFAKLRRRIVTAAVALSAMGGANAFAQPITLSIIDVGGDLSSVQPIVENYRKANPNKIKEIRIQRAPQPELPAKIKAQQDAGQLDINLIMTGQAAASALIANGQLVRLLPDHEKLFPLADFTDAATAHLKEGGGLRHPVSRQQRRPGFHLQSEARAQPAEERAGIARLGEGQSGQVLLCTAVQ